MLQYLKKNIEIQGGGISTFEFIFLKLICVHTLVRVQLFSSVIFLGLPLPLFQSSSDVTLILNLSGLDLKINNKQFMNFFKYFYQTRDFTMASERRYTITRNYSCGLLCLLVNLACEYCKPIIIRALQKCIAPQKINIYKTIHFKMG